MNYRYAITLYAASKKTDKINPKKIKWVRCPIFLKKVYTNIINKLDDIC